MNRLDIHSNDQYLVAQSISSNEHGDFPLGTRTLSSLSQYSDHDHDHYAGQPVQEASITLRESDLLPQRNKALRSSNPDSYRGASINKIKQAQLVYKDPSAYAIEKADFNSDKSDFGARRIKGQIMFVSGRPHQGRLFQAVDEYDGESFLNLYTNGVDGIQPLRAVNNQLNQGPIDYSMEHGWLFVTTNHPVPQSNSKRDYVSKLRIAIFKELNGEWREEYDFPYNNEEYSVGHPSYDTKTHTLYFASDMPGGYGGVDLYASDYKFNSEYGHHWWSEPRNLGPNINSEHDEMFPFIDDERGTLYFTSDRPEGYGGLDMYLVVLQDQYTVTNLGYSVNSAKDDFGLTLNDYGDSGYFSSNRQNDQDDIYEFTNREINIKSRLVDLMTNQSLHGSLTILDMVSGRQIPYSWENDEAIFQGIQGREYIVMGKKSGYEENHIHVHAPLYAKQHEVDLLLHAKRDMVHQGVVVHGLNKKTYYKLSDHGIEPVSREEYDLLITYELECVFFDLESAIPNNTGTIKKLTYLMSDYQMVDVVIVAYVDTNGDAEYNQQLAQRRADQVAGMLRDQGITYDRITATTISEDTVLNNCGENWQCRDWQLAQNRRVDFLLK